MASNIFKHLLTYAHIIGCAHILKILKATKTSSIDKKHDNRIRKVKSIQKVG